MPGATFNPSPQTFGATKGLTLEELTNSIHADLGSAYSQDPDSFVYLRSMTFARALKYLWSLNARLGNQWSAALMTDFLERWEDIFGLSHQGTMAERRGRVAAKFLAFGAVPTQTLIESLMDELLGEVFVSVEHIAPEDGNGSVPGGATIPGGAVLSDDNFRSQTGYIGILVQQPASMSDHDFYETVAQINPILDSMLPAWVDFAWVRDVTDGYGNHFFQLDHQPNLDNSRF